MGHGEGADAYIILETDLLEPTAGLGVAPEEWTVTALNVVETDPSNPAAPVSRDKKARLADGVVSDLRMVDLHDEATRHELTTQLIEANTGVARSIASRYRDRGIDIDDLQQVALLALTRAAQRFDPDAGHDFLSFAVPTIRGEIRRHFRDAGWMVRPPRRVQELRSRIPRAQEELVRELGRSPRPTEIAAHLDEDLDHVIDALSADGCFTPTSLDTPIGSGSRVLGDLLPGADRDLETAEARIVLSPALQQLTDLERLVLAMRFVEQRTQEEIGQAIGLSQPAVSRTLTGILRRLRAELE